MSGFLGSYLYQVDSKGRVTLPAAFRREDDTGSFVLIQAFQDALSLYPAYSWKTVEEGLRDFVRRNPERRHYALELTANAQSVSPDKQGRILVPDRLRSAVGIEADVMIVGAIDRIELWNPERFAGQGQERDEDAEKVIQAIFL